MKTTADATIPVNQFMAKFEMCHIYKAAFIRVKTVRQDKNRWAFNTQSNEDKRCMRVDRILRIYSENFIVHLSGVVQ
jgi:hypothetical protein